MHPLSAAMPDVEVPRSDVVTTRIARKVGPLFGLVWDHNQFGCTWVCDFGAITLAEIARGAPYPVRHVQAELDQIAPQQGQRDAEPRHGGTTAWRLAGRGVWTPKRAPTPTALTHTTLNRYGPDTKAAVVLTGANRLLREVTAAVAEVCRSLAVADATPEIRLTVWAGLVLEAFRGQPALVAAAIQARDIQRALTAPWGQHLWVHGLPPSARCEFGAGAEDTEEKKPVDADNSQQPTRLDLIDTTLPLLALPIPVVDGPLLSQREVLDEIASRWCHRLLQIGHPGRGVTWVAEDPPGHRCVQSHVRIGSAIAPFVAEVLADLSVTPGAGSSVCPDQISGLLSQVDLAELPTAGVRAQLMSAHVLANYLRFHDGLLIEQPAVRGATRQLCDGAATAAVKWLGPDDPVTLLLTGYAAYLHAWDLGREADADAEGRAAAAAVLRAQLDRLTTAWRSRQLDPGTASYLLEIGSMALDRLRVPGLDSELEGLWRDAMLARGVDPDTDLDDPLALPEAQQYHLQNYAAFLASRAESADDLRRALAAQRACVKVREHVTQGELAAYSAKFTSARTSRQAAAAIAGRLLRELGPATGAEYGELLAEGVAHARAAIENPTTAMLLRQSAADDAHRADPELARLVLAIAPVLLLAWEHQRRIAGAAVLVDDALLGAMDRLLGAIAAAPALSAADREAIADLRRHRAFGQRRPVS